MDTGPDTGPRLSRTPGTGHRSAQTPQPQSELEKAMAAIIDVFHQYSRREGDRDTLSRGELRLLLEKQLANFLRHVKNKGTVDQIFKDLDANKDGQVGFGEMMLLVTRVTCATHEHLHELEEHQHHHQQHQH